MVNACMKTTGVVGSSVVAIASLAISIAEYIKPEDGPVSTSTSPSPTPSDPSPSPAPEPFPSPSASPTSSALSSPASFFTIAPTSPEPPSSFPPPSPSSLPFSPSPTPSPKASPGAPNESSGSLNDISQQDFNAMAFGFLLASVFFLVLSICLWRSSKGRSSSETVGQEEQQQEDVLHRA